MDYYVNACEQLDGAEVLAASGKYRLAVTLLCLSCELFLKSLAESKDPENPLLDSHDIVGLGYFICNDVDYKELAPKLAFIRKYLNDSRYPFDVNIYTEEFYRKCYESVSVTKREIDSVNAKKSVLEQLSKKFGKDKVVDKSENIK